MNQSIIQKYSINFSYLSLGWIVSLTTLVPAWGQTEVTSNQAITLYNQALDRVEAEEIEQAGVLFEQSINTSQDTQVEAKSCYNLGNVAYENALQHVEKKASDQAIDELKQAIKHYRQALQLSPMDHEARINMELANKLIEQLKQEQQEQKQEQQQQQKQEEQEQQSETNENQNKSQQPQEQEQQQSESSDNQQNPQDQNQSQNTEQQQSSQPDQSAEQQQQNQTPGDAADQPQPAEGQAPTPESAQPDTKPSSADSQNIQAFDPEANEEPLQALTLQQVEELTDQEASQLLQAIRDRHLERRIENFQRQRAQAIPVEQDW